MSCKDWTQAFEAELLGEPLTDELRARAAAHEASCEACAGERAAWNDLSLLAERDDASPRADFVDGVLEAFDRSAPAPRPASVVRTAQRVRPARWGWAAAGALAAAAAAFFVVRAIRNEPASPVAGARVEAASGDARIDAAPAVVATGLQGNNVLSTGNGRLCLAVDPGVRVCLDRDTEATVGDLTLAHRRIDVRRGHVVAALDPQPAGASFSLSTPAGSVTAIGTQFSVNVSASGAVVAQVEHGVVVVRGGGHAAEDRLRTHEQMDLATRQRTLTPTPDEHADQALLDGTAPPPSPPPPPAAPTASESATAPPPSADVPAVAPPPAAPSNAPDAPSAAELLRSARSLRGDHKLAEAAQTYRKLQRAFPASVEAHASYVSLGELQLGGLHDASGALQSFDTYLATPGSLAQEARYGRIRALRALGRTADEKLAIRAFLADFPQSAEAPELRGELAK